MTTEEQWTVRRVLEWTIKYLREQGSESPRLDAEILLAHARNCPRIQLYTHYDVLLTEQERGLMRGLVKRRAASEPVAYLVGHKEFFSLDFIVDRHVLIPRPDTETLVMAALDAAKETASPQILELCTGSGCIAVALSKNLPRAQIAAVDISPEAIDVARRNVQRHQVTDRVELLTGDLYEPLGRDRRFDLIVSNPPYVRHDEILGLEADVREHEPHLALDGGADGLDVIRRIVHNTHHYLKQNGWLMLELSPDQADTTCQLLKQNGFQDVNVLLDLAGRPRVVIGRQAT